QANEQATCGQLQVCVAGARERADGSHSESDRSADEGEEARQSDDAELGEQLEVAVVDDVRVVDDEPDRGQICRSARVGGLDRREIADADTEDRMVARDLAGNRPDVRAATPSTGCEVEDARPNVRRRCDGE